MSRTGSRSSAQPSLIPAAPSGSGEKCEFPFSTEGVFGARAEIPPKGVGEEFSHKKFLWFVLLCVCWSGFMCFFCFVFASIMLIQDSFFFKKELETIQRKRLSEIINLCIHYSLSILASSPVLPLLCPSPRCLPSSMGLCVCGGCPVYQPLLFS